MKQLCINIDDIITNPLLDTKLTDMYCKHMVRIDNNNTKANKLLQESRKIGYDICEWGLHRGYPSSPQHHMGIIRKMEKDNYNHTVRIVICKYDFYEEPIIWIDNLHSAIKYIREYGRDVKLQDIPFYIVDISKYDSPSICGYNHFLKNNYENILGAVSCAYKRFSRSNSKELIDVHYTIEDLLNDNPWLLN